MGTIPSPVLRAVGGGTNSSNNKKAEAAQLLGGENRAAPAVLGRPGNHEWATPLKAA